MNKSYTLDVWFNCEYWADEYNCANTWQVDLHETVSDGLIVGSRMVCTEPLPTKPSKNQLRRIKRELYKRLTKRAF